MQFELIVWIIKGEWYIKLVSKSKAIEIKRTNLLETTWMNEYVQPFQHSQLGNLNVKLMFTVIWTLSFFKFGNAVLLWFLKNIQVVRQRNTQKWRFREKPIQPLSHKCP